QAHRAAGFSPREPHRFCYCIPSLAGNDVFLRDGPNPERALVTAVPPSRNGDRTWCRPLAFGLECGIPRRPISAWLRDTDLVVCNADRVSQQHVARAVAHRLRIEPDGRGG